MTKNEAEKVISRWYKKYEGLYFGLFRGKSLKIDLYGNIINSYFYDKKQGEGAGKRAIDDVRNNKPLTLLDLVPNCLKKDVTKMCSEGDYTNKAFVDTTSLLGLSNLKLEGLTVVGENIPEQE